MAHAGYPVGRGAALLVELDGAEDECEARFEEVVRDLRAVRLRRRARRRATRPSAQLFWKTRKAAFPAMGRSRPNYFVQDGVIPRTSCREVLDRIDELRGRVRHEGRQRLPRRRRQPPPARLLRRRGRGRGRAGRGAGGQDPRACLDAGGSITGEHGVGVDKRRYMPKMFGEPDLAAFQKLRCAFDPAGLANPGKVMPTPRLCGEVPARTGAPAGGRRPGRALRWRPRRSRRAPRSPEEAAELLRTLGGTGGHPRPRRRHEARAGRRRASRSRSRSSTDGLGRVVEHDEGDFTAVLEAGMPLAEAQERCRARRARCSRSTRRSATATAATLGGVLATADSGPAAPPLRRRARPRRRDHRRAVGRLAGQGGRAGHQERRGLRPRQALRRLVRHARAGVQRRRCGCTRAPTGPRRAWGASADPARARRRRRDPRRAPARGRLPRRRLARRRRARRSSASAARRPSARPARSSTACAPAGLDDVQASADDEALWTRPARRPALGRRRRAQGRPARPADLAAVLAAARDAGGSVVGRAALGLRWITLEGDDLARAGVEAVRARARARGSARSRTRPRPSAPPSRRGASPTPARSS